MNLQEEINGLIAGGTVSRSRLMGLLREIVPAEGHTKQPRKKSEPAPPATVYTEVKRNYTCLHCQTTFSKVVKLTKGEDTVVVTHEGKVQIINSASPAEVACVTSFCEACQGFVKKLSREELEERYMILLSMTSLVGRPNTFGKQFTIEEVKI